MKTTNNATKNRKNNKQMKSNPAKPQTMQEQPQETITDDAQPIPAEESAETAPAEVPAQTDEAAVPEGTAPETVVGTADETAAPIALLPIVAATSPITKFNEEQKFVQLIDITKIIESENNPRKKPKPEQEEGLLELAENIKAVGILQPICVRPKGDFFEIVYGERRFHAAAMAGLNRILAIVRELSDEEAEDLAITENLQREDITPLEEAAAFQRALDTGRHKIDTLMVKFGKSESYIRSRLVLNKLIEQMAALLKTEEINIGVAIEVAKYEAKVQEEVYDHHFKNDDVMSWRNVRIKDIAKRLYETYMPQLSRYNFDMTECKKCGHNTMNQVLFKECVEECGACQNPECMFRKNEDFLHDKAVQMLKDDPRTMLAVQSDSSISQVIETLEEEGYEVTQLPMYVQDQIEVPEKPDEPEPNPDDYEDEGGYNEAMADYADEMLEYKQDCADFEQAISEGRIRKYAVIEDRDVTLLYEEIEEEEVATDEVDDEGRQIYKVIAPEPPIEALKRQDRINYNRYVQDTRHQIRDMVCEGKVTRANLKQEEKKIVQYTLLRKEIPNSRFKELGIELNNNLDPDAQILAAVEGLTPQHFNMLLRMYIQKFFKEVCVPAIDKADVEMDLLDEFAEQNYKKEADEIRAKYTSEYEKKHAKLMEQIAANEKLEAEATTIEEPDWEPEMIPETNPEPDPDEYPFIDDPETAPEPQYIPIEEDDELEMLTPAA